MARKALIEQICKDMLADLVTFEPNALVPRCPLCLESFVMDMASPKRPTAEHIIQSSLGGKLDYATVTCAACNNHRGSSLEGDLRNAMNALDVMESHGTVPITIKNEVGHVAANLELSRGGEVAIKVLGEKASNMKAVAVIPDLIHKDATITLNLDWGFRDETYRRAVLRIGYLAAFKFFGYAYATSEAAAMVRRVMTTEVPPEGVIFEAYPNLEPPIPFVVQQVMPAVLVLFKVQSRVTRWLGVALPGKSGCSWDSLTAALTNVARMRTEVTFEKFGVSTSIRFERDPVQRLLLEAIKPATSPSS